MARKLLMLPFVVALLFAVPAVSRTNAAIEIVEFDNQEISISVKASVKIDGPDKFYDLNLPKGCYIVKVGRMTRKISIK